MPKPSVTDCEISGMGNRAFGVVLLQGVVFPLVPRFGHEHRTAFRAEQAQLVINGRLFEFSAR